MVDETDVEHIAGLADVGITPEEVEEFTSQFTGILDYFGILDGVEEQERERSGPVNVLREDTPAPPLSQDEVLANAGATEDGFIKAPRVMQ